MHENTNIHFVFSKTLVKVHKLKMNAKNCMLKLRVYGFYVFSIAKEKRTRFYIYAKTRRSNIQHCIKRSQSQHNSSTEYHVVLPCE